MKRRAGWVALSTALGAAGCLAPQVPVMTPPAAGVRRLAAGGGDGFGGVASAPLGARVTAARQAFAEASSTAEIAREVWVSFLREGQSDGFEVETRARGCVGFQGLAREGVVDLNLEVFSASGERAGDDLRADARPYVQLCGEAGRWAVRARAARGAGEVAVMLVRGAPGVTPVPEIAGDATTLTGLFSGPRAGRPELGHDPAQVAPRVLVDETMAALSARGFRPTLEVFSGQLGAHESDEAEVNLEADACYVAHAWGDRGIAELDLALFGRVEGLVARDNGLGAHATMRFCAHEAAAYRLGVRAATGRGAWSAALARMPDGPGAGVLSARLRGVMRARALELAIEARERGMRPVEAGRLGQPWGGANTLDFQLPVRAGRCYLAGAAASDGVEVIETWLSGPGGVTLASDTTEFERARVFHCAARDGVLQAHVRVRSGLGPFFWMAFESGEP
ncbi:MAG: hypothetical protein JNK72_01400 [Myxococcales bacterium]|nr:hypothetical protein [Myxococcales bacterium]